jgi:hypothetical protein
VIEKLMSEKLGETEMDPEQDRASPKVQKLRGDGQE